MIRTESLIPQMDGQVQTYSTIQKDCHGHGTALSLCVSPITKITLANIGNSRTKKQRGEVSFRASVKFNNRSLKTETIYPEKTSLFLFAVTLNCTFHKNINDVPVTFNKSLYWLAQHLLQHCRLHDALRRDMWPEPTLLRDKLYGNLEELRRTAAFVRATGISI